MRAALIVLVLVAGCEKKTEPTSRASGPAAAGPPDAAPAPAKPACDLAGDYRLRFRSNGADGWWLRLNIAGDKAALAARDVMSVLSPPLVYKGDGCKATITSRNDHSGDVKLEFTLDAKTNAVTGELSRTKGGENSPADTVPVAGRRDVGPIASPACIVPGVYSIEIGDTRWKLSEGKPGMGGCKDFTSQAEAKVRVEPLGDQLFVDEVSGEKNEQSFARGKVTRKSDCELDLELEVQDFAFTATVKLDGDKLSGVASKARFQVFEDGEAGENLWACTAKDAPIEGKRIAN